MKPSEAYDLLGPAEFERWFARRMRRQLITNRCISAVIAIVSVTGTLYGMITAFTDAYGPSAWGTGLFLALLMIYGAYMVYRYLLQADERDEFND